MTKKIHYFSGIVLILFIGGHILNHSMIFISPEAHIRFMEAFRLVYRFPPVEVLIFAACGAQLVTGFLLLRRKWRRPKGIWDRLQMYSGMYFLYFLVIHPLAVLFGRHVWGLDTNIYFGASVVNVSPYVYYYVFHYAFAILAFFTHLACVHRVKMARLVAPRFAEMQSIAMIAVGLLLAVLIVSHMIGIDIPAEYLENY